MARLTLGFAAALVVLGAIAFATTRAKTSLIPAYVGIALGICGLVAQKDAYRKHAMHAAAAIAALGFLAAAGRLIGAFARGTTPATAALVSLALMALLCGAFVAICVRSFVLAQRQRSAGG